MHFHIMCVRSTIYGVSLQIHLRSHLHCVYGAKWKKSHFRFFYVVHGGFNIYSATHPVTGHKFHCTIMVRLYDFTYFRYFSQLCRRLFASSTVCSSHKQTYTHLENHSYFAIVFANLNHFLRHFLLIEKNKNQSQNKH